MAKTCRQARIAKTANPASPNLANLPAEIIHEIVRHLDLDQLPQDRGNDSDADAESIDLSDCETLNSVDLDNSDDSEEEKKRSCTLTCCRDGRMHEVMGGRGGDDTMGICIANSLKLSACSKRLREIIFVEGRKRARNIRYCDWWRKETLTIPEQVRQQYK
jgi:hypothetical protein